MQFDAVEANLARLETVLSEYERLVPDGIAFMAGSQDARKADELSDAFDRLIASLPAIDSWSVTARLVDLDDIAQTRMDAAQIGEVMLEIDLQRRMSDPSDQVAEYRRPFVRRRRALIRERAGVLLDEIDGSLAEAAAKIKVDREPVTVAAWGRFKTAFGELERLLGASVAQGGRWAHLKRHLAFGYGVDLHDIVDHDWPSVRPQIVRALYDPLEPMPVTVADLSTLVESRPTGPVASELEWASLGYESFERLIFELLRTTSGYENVKWEMRTTAPDRSRDIAADRVIHDPLSGTHRKRVVVQCKHWMAKSLSPAHIQSEVASAKLWSDPPVDVLIIATSGRFTMDAVSWIEKHNGSREHPSIESWANSHLESLLAQRPNLVAEFGLRRT